MQLGNDDKEEAAMYEVCEEATLCPERIATCKHGWIPALPSDLGEGIFFRQTWQCCHRKALDHALKRRAAIMEWEVLGHASPERSDLPEEW